MKKSSFLFLMLLWFCLIGQDSPSINFIEDIKNRDVSHLWVLDSMRIENDDIYIQRQPPLGYIGNNFQRIKVRFISAIKNPYNNLEYFIFGKTKVRDNICDFQGTITITEAKLYADQIFDDINEGFFEGNYIFFEDPKQQGTGTFSGSFRTDFYLDNEGNLNYNAIFYSGAGFMNNQFEGVWKSYLTGVVRKCNWGDYRIPDSKELDPGTSEFMVDDRFWKFGWESFVLSRMYPSESVEVMEALKKEKMKWWVECYNEDCP